MKIGSRAIIVEVTTVEVIEAFTGRMTCTNVWRYQTSPLTPHPLFVRRSTSDKIVVITNLLWEAYGQTNDADGLNKRQSLPSPASGELLNVNPPMFGPVGPDQIVSPHR